MKEVRAYERDSGLVHLSEPGHIDVDAQIVELARLDPARLDPRLAVPGIERLAKSDAFLVNIDYPLGMAAYHLLSRLGQGVGELRGVYVMGKAATLNGRVGDVSLSGIVYDEHSGSTFLFKNAFGAKDVRPYLLHGSVFDNQSALNVKSAFLQNKHYMGTFYREGYTVLEMEAGPVFVGRLRTRAPYTRSVRRDRPPLRADAVRRRDRELRVGHALLAKAVALVEEPLVLRSRRDLCVRDRDRSAHSRAGGPARVGQLRTRRTTARAPSPVSITRS